MTFDASVLFDHDLLVNGPLVVYWGQDCEEFSRRELTFGDRPHLPLRARLRRARPWRVAVRLAPPSRPSARRGSGPSGRLSPRD
jgi:hypothetical protein